MNILLQRKVNQEFIATRGGSWTVHRGRAHSFANGLEAVMFCYDRHLAGMQIVATFLDSRMNFTVPVANG